MTEVVAGAPAMAAILEWVARIGFPIVIAIYLITKTTEAISGLTQELREMRHDVTDIGKEFREDNTNLRTEVRTLTDQIRALLTRR